MLYISSFALGVGPIPAIMTGEAAMSRARPVMWPDTAARSGRLAGRGSPEPGAARGVLWRREPPLARQLAQGAARVAASQLLPTARISPLYLPYISPTTPL